MLTTTLQNLLNQEIEKIKDETVQVLNIEINNWENYDKHRVYVEIETGSTGNTSRYIKFFYELENNSIINTRYSAETKRYNEDTIKEIVKNLNKFGTEIVNDALGIKEFSIDEIRGENNMEGLKNLKVIELKEMAKEAKVPNWWTLKKSDLINALEKEEKEIEEIGEKEKIEKEKIEKEKIEKEKIEKETKEKETKEKEEEDLITLKEIIAKLGIKGTKARRILRGSNIERPYKRWEWSTTKHSDIIKEVYDLLSK